MIVQYLFCYNLAILSGSKFFSSLKSLLGFLLKLSFGTMRIYRCKITKNIKAMLKFCTIIHTPRKVVGQLKIRTINNEEQFRILKYKQLTTMRKLILWNIKGLYCSQIPQRNQPYQIIKYKFYFTVDYLKEKLYMFS